MRQCGNVAMRQWGNEAISFPKDPGNYFSRIDRVLRDLALILKRFFILMSTKKIFLFEYSKNDFMQVVLTIVELS